MDPQQVDTSAAAEPEPAAAPGETPPEPLPQLKPQAVVFVATAEALAYYDAESVRLITESMKEVDDAQKEFDGLNTEMKEAKIKWQGLVQKQHSLIRERRDARGKPVQKTLFDNTIRADDPPPKLELASAPATPDALENLWREFPLDRFSIWGATEGDLAKLREGTRKRDEPRPLGTMGQLADFSSNVHNPGYENRLTDFKGIGAAAADRINASIERFWGWWNDSGRTEFATERGLISENQPRTDSEGGGGGDQGNSDQPGSLGDAVGQVLDRVIPDTESGTEDAADFVEPEGAEAEYSLTGAGTAEE